MSTATVATIATAAATGGMCLTTDDDSAEAQSGQLFDDELTGSLQVGQRTRAMATPAGEVGKNRMDGEGTEPSLSYITIQPEGF